jgi:hypothetical protein
MRSPQLILLPIILIITVCLLLTSQSSEQPTDEAVTFLTKLKSGDVEASVAEFGDNTCHCAPVGGYINYLRYESDENPNYAFLLGQKFSIGQPRQIELPFNGEKYLLPWDRPEDRGVFVPISFDNAQTRPYFIPLDTAYGYTIDNTDLEKFLNDPAEGYRKGFCLRLREQLGPGFIKPYVKGQKNQSEADKLAEKGLLPPEMLRYLHPADPGQVKASDGKLAPISASAERLPRLKSMILGMKVVRRGWFKRWSVKKIGLEEAVIALPGGKDITLLQRDLNPAAQQGLKKSG